MEENLMISVIVPVYKVEPFLPKCVDSILNQTYQNLEVILVDDGSPDACGAICDAYATQDPRVRVIHKENGGLSSARNAGIEVASGEYLAFVDSDDWLEPDAYGQMMAVMHKFDAKLVCAGRYDVDSQTGEKVVGLCPQKEECISAEEMVGKIFLWDGCDSSACDKLYHRSLLESFRYPEGKICEDVPVTYKIVLKARKVGLCPRPVYNYFHRINSITTETAVTESCFHFPRHTEEIYEFICIHYPKLKDQVTYLRIQSLSYILILLDQGTPEDRKRFANEYREARRDLAKFTGFLLTSPHFETKDRIRDLLLVLGCYRLLRPIFHR